MVLNGIPISEEECIGDSLATINSAFQTLSSNVESLNSNSNLSVVDSPTIDLSYNSSTGVLSANVIGSSLTTSISSSLSASPMVAKAWVNFDGTGIFSPNPSNTKIRSSYNVSSITKLGTGRYQINFSTSLSNSNYSIIGSAAVDGIWGSSGTGKVVGPEQISSNTVSNCIFGCGTSSLATDSAIISVSIFGN